MEWLAASVSLRVSGAVLVIFLCQWCKICEILQPIGSKRQRQKKSICVLNSIVVYSFKIYFFLGGEWNSKNNFFFSKAELDEKSAPAGSDVYFEELLPCLPPGVGPWPARPTLTFCPAPDMYPPNWQDLPLGRHHAILNWELLFYSAG